MKRNVLLVDDDPGIQFGFSRYFSNTGFGIKAVSSLAEARQAIMAQRFDAVLLDLMLPDGKGLDWLDELRDKHPGIAIVVITGHGDIPLVVEAMHRGADNFLTKPVSLEDLDLILQKSLEIGILRRNHLTNQRLSKKIQPYFGESTAIKKVLELARLAAENDSAVILQGETGAGKGVLARWINDNSHLSSAPFIEINCSSLKGELLASELFGHARGAFTSATQDKPGLIEVADGGTLFLDEIGDMSLCVQAEFLKVIEEKHFRRLGEVTVRRSEFRLICSTNQDLLKKIQHGSFRQDLYFRINVFPIQLPSLRSRIEDLPGLVCHLLETLGAPHPGVSSEVLELLKAYSWPGNVRELRNVLERAMLLARGGPLAPRHFIGLQSPRLPADTPEDILGLEEMEKIHIKKVLDSFNGDTRKAAELLGISLATLYRKLKKIPKDR
ncbi:MAG: sigma-54-dependent Fis family transcriptional regulator [Candidatus Glassbacteria bacterium]|nr:sigma-54-dependent Fis family transcriptional regulator [Candidatus Glassbacteria bacterium]